MQQPLNQKHKGNNEWRLMNQEEYLTNAHLIFCEYKGNPRWDHDHCAFCCAKFSEAENNLHFGYCTLDRYYWICEECFEDFKDVFSWQLDFTDGDEVRPSAASHQ